MSKTKDVVSTGQWREIAKLVIGNLPEPAELDPELSQAFVRKPELLKGNLRLALTSRPLRFLTDEERAKLAVGENEEVVLPLEAVIAPGATITLADGWEFTADEVLDLAVDYALPVETINKKMGLDMELDWEYIAESPLPEKKTVRAVIGRLNQNWTEEQVTELLAKPDCPFKGSGAWVREGFLAVRPRYDGKGWIGFPDSKTSRWRPRHLRFVYFPNLWDAGSGWDRDLCWVRNECSREVRLCLLCG